jgi:hypothetical protein
VVTDGSRNDLRMSPARRSQDWIDTEVSMQHKYQAYHLQHHSHIANDKSVAAFNPLGKIPMSGRSNKEINLGLILDGETE